MNLLKKGDIIEIKKGHTIYGDIEERFLCSNDSYHLIHHDIIVGQRYEQRAPLEEGDEGYDPDFLKREYARQKDPNYKGMRGVVGFPSKEIDFYDSNVFAGDYIVLYTTEDGGGTQGTLSGTESFPNGHHVFCKKIINEKVSWKEIDFYQTGCFTAMITDIEPKCKARLNYTYELLK